MAAKEFAKEVSLVCPGVVEQRDHRAAEMTKQVTKELADFHLADVVEVETVIEPQSLTLGAHRDARDDRHLVPAVAMPDDRRLAARSPGTQDVGDQEEPRFVAENEVGAQPSGVFFTLGHSSRFQRAITRSSRSTARRSGF